MASYRLLFKKSVTRDLRRLPNTDVTRVLRSIEDLADNPRPIGAKKLAADNRYRIRQGVYRVLYDIRDAELIVLVVKVAHRSDVYRRKN